MCWPAALCAVVGGGIDVFDVGARQLGVSWADSRRPSGSAGVALEEGAEMTYLAKPVRLVYGQGCEPCSIDEERQCSD